MAESKEGNSVDFMAVTVTLSDDTTEQIENIESWKIDEYECLQVLRRTVPVVIYARGKWKKVSLLYRLDDGSTISQDGDTGPPTDVGMGVTATAIGGRTA